MAKTKDKGTKIKSYWCHNFQADVEKLLELLTNADFSNPEETRQVMAQVYNSLLSLRGNLMQKIDRITPVQAYVPSDYHGYQSYERPYEPPPPPPIIESPTNFTY